MSIELLRRAACAKLLTVVAAAAATLPNPSFEEGGEGTPTGWTLTGGGTWERGVGSAAGQHCVTVTGDGQWASDPVPLTPGGAYELRFRCQYRPDALFTGGNAVAGPAFAIQVIPLAADEAEAPWREHALRFAAPADPERATSRFLFWQWRLQGAVAYDAVELSPLAVAHRRFGDIRLGVGERVETLVYTFDAPLGDRKWRNISRPLASGNAVFHDNRWRFSAVGDHVVYKHAVAGRRQLAATVRPQVWFHAPSSWALRIEASVDGVAYREIGRVGATGDGQDERTESGAEIPGDMLPAEAIWVRLSVDASDAATPTFSQVLGYTYEATLDGPPLRARGDTVLVRVVDPDPRLGVDPLWEPAPSVFAASVTNRGAEPVRLEPFVRISHESGESRDFPGAPLSVAAGASVSVAVPYRTWTSGEYGLELSFGRSVRTRLRSSLSLSVLRASHYGKRLASPDPGVALWWASSGWKVSRTRPAPAATGPAVRVSAARNEAECAQLVVRPVRDLRALTASIGGDLRSDAGTVLPASAVEVLRVRYVDVRRVSDAFGETGLWPDPLPPFRGGIDVPAGVNQPLWVRASIPSGTVPGVYAGAVVVRADGFRADVPIEVEVFDVTLPEETTCRSLFGFDWGNVPRYHRLATGEQQRQVLDLYLRSFGDHRISPYNPVPLDPFRYEWDTGMDWVAGTLIAGEAHSGTKCLLSADTSETGNSYASHTGYSPVTGAPLELSLWLRTESADEPAAIYLCHYDAGKQWFRGRNRHIVVPPTTGWSRFEATMAEFPEGTAFVRPLVQGCQYTEKGERTGRVWIDDVSLIDTGTGRELIADGDFEAVRPIGAQTGLSFDWAAWDAAMRGVIDRYHFNSFLFRVPGLGSGTFYARSPGDLLGYAQGTPEHLALFRRWCTTAREHLLEAGLLDKAVCYPFDEPAEKDYAFVVEQLGFLKRELPGLRRMVPMNLGATEAFCGWIDMWCPVLSSHSATFARARQAAGEQYVWYICCSPKAPYIANFIDRPATDLRVWLWQTWKEGVDGILIWQSLYWHSPPAYPDALQDPYEDSMSWVRGYGTKPGERRPWNVGDGRFMYPPEAAVDGGAEPAIDGPVSSIRWEALRDGVEDYEYLAVLRRLLGTNRDKLTPEETAGYAALLEVPADIAASLTTYTRDPAPIEARRRALAEAIARLSRR